MNADTAIANGFVPTTESSASPVNIDPDFHLSTDRGNGFVRAYRIIFPKSA